MQYFRLSPINELISHPPRLLQLRLFHRFQLLFVSRRQIRKRVWLPLHAFPADLAASDLSSRSPLQFHDHSAPQPPLSARWFEYQQFRKQLKRDGRDDDRGAEILSCELPLSSSSHLVLPLPQVSSKCYYPAKEGLH